MKNLLMALSAMLLAVGCQTAPVRYDQQQEGYWQAKALVRDKKAGKSAVVNLDINAIQNSKLRVDVTAALGHPVATLVTAEENVSYVLFEDRAYYAGKMSSQSLKPVLSVPLNPNWLMNVLFDTPITDKGWACGRDKKGYLTECKSLAEGMTVIWSERQGRRKRIQIDHTYGSIQINVATFRPKVEERANLFSLSAPKGFKVLK